ncbi:hypothetical protein [Asticcacaulis sp.]|uniref:hypothetical protein n=1 Tax=Asticcacaulis sp. TaxID=1872648 RepID=UPI0026025B90|nr:hypothetical protein [Asticcacaulis sp.]
MSNRRSVNRARMQGNLDGLCGVYSVVNAAIHLSPQRISQDNVKELFRALCSELGRLEKLEDALVDGMKVRTLGVLLDCASNHLNDRYGYEIKRKIAFNSHPQSLQEFWVKIAEHVAIHEKGSVILSLSGKHKHWTVVDAISDTSISLIDSDGLKRIARDRCTVQVEKGKRHHELWGTETYLLSVTN